ncbi:MAG: glycoside hydrolase family 127 protein [Armatimonadota bacterium]|nr:glycoside hydrolase family 127 protein [Armatimonadota bacterium]MCX7777845.1 glycoside hydrolase family 127 protein [Armatimonadota bacterium]MDW8025837.1 glycoside hydrolase family 127 protein [Armatimonadota bacterium]
MNARGIVADTMKSPHAKLRPIPINAVKLRDRFWQPRLAALQEVTLPTQYELLEHTGRIDNFRRVSGKVLGEFRGLYFNDSDVYKWIEAAAWSLAVQHNAKVAELINRVIPEIEAAQDEDGYLNTYFSLERKKQRWTNLRDMHELYCAGHLFQAAVAHHRVTGDERLLKVSTRFADLIDKIFGWGKKEETDGHPEIEMALVELYRETGERRYLELARFFIDVRGRKRIGGSPYHQDHKPFRELDEVTGHAVRALYLNAGAADLYAEIGDEALMQALQRMWRNLTEKRIYVTGGCGARYEGEAFGRDYELPNERAYSETCAAIANILWQWRMFLLTGESRFVDVLERSLFNGALSGIGLDGKSYFYVNPLADRGHHRRQPFFECACCPPNIARLFPMVQSFLYAISDDGIFVNLYAESTATLSFKGVPITLIQRTDYPWNGEIELQVQPGKPVNFAVSLRIPKWCPKATVKVKGKTIDAAPGTFAAVQREWIQTDTIHISLEMPAEYVFCHPFVESNGGRVAIQRGPIVYCLEQIDNPEADVWCIAAMTDRALTTISKSIADLPVIAVQGEGVAIELKRWENEIYQPLRSIEKHIRPVSFVAIPYFAWANRAKGAMTVWIARA